MTLEEKKLYQPEVLRKTDTETLQKYLASAKEKYDSAKADDDYYNQNPYAEKTWQQPEYDEFKKEAKEDVSYYREVVEQIERIIRVRSSEKYQELNSMLDELDQAISSYKGSVGESGLNKQVSLYENGVDDPGYANYLEDLAERNGYQNKIDKLYSTDSEEKNIGIK